MKIEDFNVRKSYGGQIIKPDFRFLYDVHNFGISYDKIELFESIKKYITKYDFNAELNYCMGSYYTYIQSQTPNNQRCLVAFNLLCYREDDGDRCIDTSVSEEEFYNLVNKYKRVGSQWFKMLTPVFKDSNNKVYSTPLVYSEDGNIFVSEKIVEQLKKIDINNLGSKLSFLINQNGSNHSANSNYSDESLNSFLKTRFEKGKTKRLYYAKNGKIQNL